MALSLGDVALAFAGGAAKEFNKQHAEKRQQARDLEKMRKAQKLRIAETLAVSDIKNNETRRQHNEQITSMGGPDTLKAALSYYPKALGLTTAQVTEAWEKGSLGSVPIYDIKETPYDDYESILNGDDNTKVGLGKKRIASKYKTYKESVPTAPRAATEAAPTVNEAAPAAVTTAPTEVPTAEAAPGAIPAKEVKGIVTTEDGQKVPVVSEKGLADILTATKAKVLTQSINKDTGQGEVFLDMGKGKFQLVLVDAPKGYQTKPNEADKKTETSWYVDNATGKTVKLLFDGNEYYYRGEKVDIGGYSQPSEKQKSAAEAERDRFIELHGMIEKNDPKLTPDLKKEYNFLLNKNIEFHERTVTEGPNGTTREYIARHPLDGSEIIMNSYISATGGSRTVSDSQIQSAANTVGAMSAAFREGSLKADAVDSQFYKVMSGLNDKSGTKQIVYSAVAELADYYKSKSIAKGDTDAYNMAIEVAATHVADGTIDIMALRNEVQDIVGEGVVDINWVNQAKKSANPVVKAAIAEGVSSKEQFVRWAAERKSKLAR